MRSIWLRSSKLICLFGIDITMNESRLLRTYVFLQSPQYSHTELSLYVLYSLARLISANHCIQVYFASRLLSGTFTVSNKIEVKKNDNREF